MRFRVAEFMGVRTRFLQAGHGPALLMIHGTGLSADSWFANVLALSQHYTVYAPDLLGCGFTETGPYTGGAPQELWLQHLTAMIHDLDLDQITLVGSSFGCNLAILLHERLRSHFERLVLVGPGSAFNRPSNNWRTMYKAAHENGLLAFDDPTFDNCKTRMSNAVYDPACISDALVLSQMILYAQPGAREAFDLRMHGLRLEAAIKEYEVYHLVERIRIPTLLILGQQDPRGHFDQACETSMRLHQGTLIAYDRCGHWPHIEHSETFNRDVVEFLLSTSQQQHSMQAEVL